jgi:glycosyltransferase involved in cell wall biosynthesis
MNQPKISIIVASLNSEKTIEKTISSIKNQKYGRLEVVVVDGGSTDDTINLIRTHNLLDIKIISEPDKGIGDAWNKGLRLCSGDIIGILNSDDYYDENIFQGISKFFLSVNEPLIGFGDVILINPEDGSSKLVAGRVRGKLGLLNGFGFLHPSVFFNRQTLEKVGFFNYRIRVAVDTDWLLRAVSLGVAFKKIPCLTYMRTGGVSDVNRYTGMGEYADALVRNGYSDVQMLMFFMLRFLGKLRSVMRWKKVR